MRTRIALVALALSALACGSDAPTSPNGASVAGTYTLRTIQGQPLPYILQDGANKATITRDILTITDGGTWSETANFTLSINGGPGQAQVVSASGTYSRAGASFGFFDTSTRETDFATLSGTTLTFTSDTRVFSR